MQTPLVLIIMDGWGITTPGPGNAVSLAQTPNFNTYTNVYPSTKLIASGEPVGLPKEDKGNSETGHLNIGAGRIVYQDLARINLSIANGEFYNLTAFSNLANYTQTHSSRLHLMGLLGAGGVHSSLEHLFALLNIAKKNNIRELYLHLFTDGRDSPPTSAQIYLDQVENQLLKLQLGKIASICGRYFAMDRDYHWERTQKTYDLLTQGIGQEFSNAKEAVQNSYQQGKTDEFIEPCLISKDGVIKEGDAVIFFNFRIDRPRQLTKAFVLSDFEEATVHHKAFDPYAEKYRSKETSPPNQPFNRTIVLKDLYFVTMTEYETGLPAHIAFPPEIVQLPLARILSDQGLRQLHLAETEKERFVTYYFDGQREEPFYGEDRVEIPSLSVATYDLKPEMAAREVSKELIERLQSGLYDFIVVNYANPDMVGHTGVLKAGIQACEVVDECVGQVVRAVTTLGGVVLITADHGNVEEMINLQTGQVDTEHSRNPVPLILIDPQRRVNALRTGILADIAPTILELLNIPQPESMSGQSLILK